jgi:hypothetical protein
MAGNTETLTTSGIFGTLDTAGSTSGITVKGSKLFDVSVDFDTNSFVGTITLERETRTGAANIPEWQAVEAYTESTEKVGQSATTRRYRLTVTAGPSGTAEFEMTAGNFS